MRRLLLAASIAALAACAKPAPEPAAEETPAATETDAAMTTANGSAPGMYEVTMKDGSTGSSELRGDGTYSDMDGDGKVVASGTWAVKDGKSCFTPDGGKELCWTESAPAEDGSFTATPDEGDAVTVKPKPAS
jgi:hypothetical protein